jgi:hypothetical protein
LTLVATRGERANSLAAPALNDRAEDDWPEKRDVTPINFFDDQPTPRFAALRNLAGHLPQPVKRTIKRLLRERV